MIQYKRLLKRNDAKVLADACEKYYMNHGDWPKLSDKSYTLADVYTWADSAPSFAGKELSDLEGKFYDIDIDKLARYVIIKSGIRNFVLQNPVGDVYIINPQSNVRLKAGYVTDPDTATKEQVIRYLNNMDQLNYRINFKQNPFNITIQPNDSSSYNKESLLYRLLF
jgi:hypothetical protein